MKKQIKKEDNLQEITFKITFEPIGEVHDERVRNVMYKMHQKVNKGILGLGLEKKLKDCVRKYPHIPQFKNYLALYYSRKNDTEKFKAIIEETEQKHPDYLFSKIMIAQEALYDNDLERVPEILGEYLNLQLLYPERDTFHVSEVMGYMLVVAKYYIAKEDFERAGQQLDILKDIDPDHENLKAVKQELVIKRMTVNMEKMQVEREANIEYETKATFMLEPSDQAPVLQHELLRCLYQYDLDNFPKDKMAAILELPRATLIQDLETILEDGIRRFEWFYDRKEGFIEEEQNFLIHAFRFLAALRSESSLQCLLNLLRQEEDFLDYWFADYLQGYLEATIYYSGENQLDVLYDFIIEPFNSTQGRLLVANTVAQVAIHTPNRRTEAVDWFRKVIHYHLDNKEKEGIHASDFINFLLCDLIDFRATELVDDIKLIDQVGWIQPMFAGDVDEILKEIHKPMHASELTVYPEDIYEHYSGSYYKRQVKPEFDSDSLPEIDEDELEIMRKLLWGNEDSMNEDYMDYEEEVDFQYVETPKTFVRTTAKVGRNDPCPCGSGKKYKKCCL